MITSAFLFFLFLYSLYHRSSRVPACSTIIFLIQLTMFHCYSLSECYFAGKGTVLMLGSNERLVRPNSSATHLTSDSCSSHRSISNMSHSSDFTLTTASTTAGSTTTRSASSTSHTGESMDDNNTSDGGGQSSSSGGNDIQKHLQSMFYLLRPEETLKMVCNVLLPFFKFKFSIGKRACFL